MWSCIIPIYGHVTMHYTHIWSYDPAWVSVIRNPACSYCTLIMPQVYRYIYALYPDMVMWPCITPIYGHMTMHWCLLYSEHDTSCCTLSMPLPVVLWACHRCINTHVISPYMGIAYGRIAIYGYIISPLYSEHVDSIRMDRIDTFVAHDELYQ